MDYQKPKVDFKTNVPEIIEFPFGDWKEGEGQYGKYYIHNVTNRGEDKVMFASDALQVKLNSLANLKGKTLEIAKEELDGQRKIWRVYENGTEIGIDAQPAPKKRTTGQISRYSSTDEKIMKAVAHKDEGIRFTASIRDAVQLTVAEMKQGGAWDEKVIKERINFWQKYMYDKYSSPF